MVVVRVALAGVDRHIQLIRAFDQVEAVDVEGHLHLALHAEWIHLLDVGIGPVAADAVRASCIGSCRSSCPWQTTT